MQTATTAQLDRATEVLCANWGEVERKRLTPRQLALVVVAAFLGEVPTFPLTQTTDPA